MYKNAEMRWKGKQQFWWGQNWLIGSYLEVDDDVTENAGVCNQGNRPLHFKGNCFIIVYLATLYVRLIK
jgi:hypothetical protein